MRVRLLYLTFLGVFEMSVVKKFGHGVVGLLATVAAVFSVPVFAAGPDFSALTDSVDFGTVVTAILAIAASLIVVYIAWKGAKMVMNAVKGG
jgi:hypothetical protein